MGALVERRMIAKNLKLSIENLYENHTSILNAIEEGLNNDTIELPVVGHQGVPGAYGEIATYTFFDGRWSNIVSYENFEDVIDAVTRGEIDYGVLPIENSTAGEVLDTYDLIKNNNLYIVGEQSIKIEHSLLGVPGAKLSDIKQVYSHSQALSQSKVFLKSNPQIEPVPYVNTAIACQDVANWGDKTKAAIGSNRSGKLYGLEVLKEGVNYNKNNYTRFIVIANKMYVSDDANKISIMFSTKHSSGSLYNVLGHFAYNGVNLIKILSRPLLDHKWEYYFFADLEGNLQDANVLIALSQVMKQCNHFKLLGNYVQSED